MNLIIHHMLQTLVVGWAQEDLCVQLAASVAIIEDLIAPEVVAILIEEFRDLLDVYSIIERCGISNFTLVGRNLQFECTYMNYKSKL